MSEKETVAPWPTRIALFLVWPVVVPILVVLLAVLLVATWPLLLTSKVNLNGDTSVHP
jgi:cell division septal protein FtsQ